MSIYWYKTRKFSRIVILKKMFLWELGETCEESDDNLKYEQHSRETLMICTEIIKHCAKFPCTEIRNVMIWEMLDINYFSVSGPQLS